MKITLYIWIMLIFSQEERLSGKARDNKLSSELWDKTEDLLNLKSHDLNQSLCEINK